MNVPKLRFKEFNGEWEEKTLGEVTKVVSFKNKEEAQLPIYSINNKIGFVPQEEQFENVDGISRGYDTSLYKVVIPNMFAYNPARINVGSIGYSANLSNVMISSLYVCFVLTGDNDDMFYWQWFKSVKFNVLVNRFTEGGVRQYLFYENLSRIKMLAPACSEQEKIAMFLNNIDLRISNQKSIVESLEKQKKGLMQKIFSQKLRFKDDKGEEFPDWEEKKLGEVVHSFDYGMNVASCEYDGENKYIRITDIDDLSHKYSHENVVSPNGGLEDKYLVGKNDILFARTGASTGKTYLYDEKDGKLYFAGFLIRGNVKDDYNSYFIFIQTLTSRYKKWVSIESIRSGQPGINAEQYKEFMIYVPCLKEQNKIVGLLKLYDDRIEVARNKVEHWQQIKKGLLQQMFV